MTEPIGSVIPVRHHDLLAAPLIAHLTSMGPQGEPQSTPVWLDWDGAHLLIAVVPGSQKYRNAQRDPRLALSIVDQANPARYLEVRGQVTAIDPDLDGTRLRAIVRMDTGADDLPGLEEERVNLVIEPLHTTSMGYAKHGRRVFTTASGQAPSPFVATPALATARRGGCDRVR